MRIDELLDKRRCVLEYDETVKIEQSLIEDLLRKAHKVTPSKNQFMPYRIHVLGPDNKREKVRAYENCIENESQIDGLSFDEKIAYYKNSKPVYHSIIDCSYLLIFTQRVEDQPNPRQVKLMEAGHHYEPYHEEDLEDYAATASLEVGLFATAFCGLCLEEGLDTSYCLNFIKHLSYWQDLPFIKRRPLLLMTVGRAKRTRIEVAKKAGWFETDLKPNFERIVNFVGNENT